MYHWVTSLSIEQYVMLSELSGALGNMKPDKLAIHLLEREHARVFGTRALDDDEPTNPGTPEAKNR